MTTATATPTKTEAPETEAPDFDRIENDLQGRLAALREQRQALALDSLSDDGARERLPKVEADLADTEAESGRLALARAEAERRELAAIETAKSEAQEAALGRAKQLRGERLKLAKVLDRKIVEFVDAVSDFALACDEQSRQFAAADLPQAAAGARSAQALRIEGSIALAMRGKHFPAMERLAHISGRFQRPVADVEAETRLI